MFNAFLVLLCAAGASWLVYTFGFGMLVSVGALAAAAFLFSGGRACESDAGGAE